MEAGEETEVTGVTESRARVGNSVLTASPCRTVNNPQIITAARLAATSTSHLTTDQSINGTRNKSSKTFTNSPAVNVFLFRTNVSIKIIMILMHTFFNNPQHL